MGEGPDGPAGSPAGRSGSLDSDSGDGRGEASLTRRTLAGLQWSTLETGLSAVMQMVMAGVLARLLTPAAFGLIALGNLTLRFVNYFAKGGITQAVIQKPDLSEIDIRASFALSAGLGTAFSLVVLAGAPLAATVFDAPGVVPVVRLLALSLLLHGLGATATALLRRDLRFKTLAVRNISSYVVGYVGVGLTLAVLGAGVYALVAAILTQTAVGAILSFLAAPHPVRPVASLDSYLAILGFGGRVSIIGFLEFLSTNADTAAVGRFAGPDPLGLYNRANLIGELPVYYLSNALSRVLFPAFSSVQHDLNRLGSAYLSAVSLMAALIVPTTAGMAVASREIVLVVLGSQWEGAIPVLPWLAAASAVSLVGHFAAVTLEAQGALNAKIVISATHVLILVGLLVLASGGSLAAYGAALAAGAVYAHIGRVLVVSRTLRLPVGELARPYLPALGSGGLVAGAIAGVRWLLLAAAPHLPVVLVLGAEVATGAAILALLFRFGLLRSVRADLATRLARGGLLDRAARFSGVLRWVVGSPTSTEGS